MSTAPLRHLLVAVTACLIAAPSTVAAQAGSPHLVDVTWLKQHLTDPGVLVLDASLAPMHAAQHIPGAVSVDAFTYGGRERPIAETERLYQSWGVSAGKKVVVYDQGGTFMATRLFFSLYYHGFPAENLAVLDGGLAKWQAAGLPVTKDPTPAPKVGSFRIRGSNERVRARLPEVLTATGDQANHVLVEALDADWHFGAIRAFHRAGHIPYGVLLPSADLFNADKTFKSPDELRRMLDYLNIKPTQGVVTYCGGGVAASAPFFALKFLLGYPDVQLYVESELGWLSDERELPYWTYDAPYLVRRASWLQWTSSQMLRTYVGAPVSVIDLRPAETYAQGHVPYALNIPAPAFRSHLGKREQFAEALGAAGVDSSLEAVVVSGAGITPDAALALVMLEAAGQKKVSVLADPADAWAQQGLTVTKEPTIVGRAKTPRDMAVAPKAYPLSASTGALVATPQSTKGLYPKVFIASGSSLPAGAPEGTIVHVPYRDLLNADGTPKAAKEIWTILSKAGVPRYAELVCVSDDPGEAAVTYVILRLMGYPDVKVLVR